MSTHAAGSKPPRRAIHAASASSPTSLDAEQLSAAVRASDVPAIVGHLYGEQQRLRSLAAVEVHAHMTQVAAELMELTVEPEQLTLDIIHSGGVGGKRSGCWVDLPTLLLKALDEHRQLASSSPIQPALIALASTVLHSAALSARSYALLIRVFSIPYSFSDGWKVVSNKLSSGDRREAADLAVRLDMLPQLSDDRHELLLSELVKAQELDSIHKYVDALPDSQRERWLSYVVEQTADEIGGNNVTAACRLIAHYGRRLIEYPHVAHLKAKHELWWACRIGKSDEFAHLLTTTGDVRLQRSLIRQLSKGRYEGDVARMYRWIERFDLASDADVQAVVQQVQLAPPQAQFSTAVTTETVEERAAPTFSMPTDTITFVHDEGTIAQALTVLSRHTGEESMLGFDCEYLPEAYFQLGVGSSSTQLLQIACSEHTFLVDLQLLVSPPTPSQLTQRLVDVLLVVLSSDAVKLGIGFEEDMRRLRADFSHLACFQVTVRRYCDLKPLLRMEEAGGDSGGQGRGRRNGKRGRRRGKPNEVRGSERDDSKAEDDGKLEDDGPGMPSSQLEEAQVESVQQLQPPMMKREGGLARLCRVYTGCRLDKSCQISNWSRRPLTREQTMYAACDAYVQLLIHKEAVRRGQRLQETEIDG